MEYWNLVENPAGETYRQLIKVLSDHSDKFYFVTRKELKYNPDILTQFKPYTLETYKTKKRANTIRKGLAATIYVIKTNRDTCKLLQQSASTLYN